MRFITENSSFYALKFLANFSSLRFIYFRVFLVDIFLHQSLKIEILLFSSTHFFVSLVVSRMKAKTVNYSIFIQSACGGVIIVGQYVPYLSAFLVKKLKVEKEEML